MKLITFGPARDDSALAGALSTWLTRLPADCKLVLVFAPHDAKCSQILKLVNDNVKHAVVVGATTGGVAFTERGFDPAGVVVGAVHGDDVEAVASVVRNVSRSTRQSVKAAIDELAAAGNSANSALLTLCDGLAGGEAANGDVFMKHVAESTPLAWRVFGGRAGDHWKFKEPRVFHGNQELRDAAVFVRIKTQGRLSIGAQHGWTFEDGAQPMVVTAALGTVISTLGDKPAAQVLAEEFRRLGFATPGGNLQDILPRHPLALRTPFGEGLKPRAIISLNDDGTVALGGGVSVGDTLRLAKASTDELLHAAKTLADRVREESTNKGNNGSIVFDCAGRVFLLRDRYQGEVAAFGSANKAPVLGTSCYGEFARFGTSVDRFFNNTAIMATW